MSGGTDVPGRPHEYSPHNMMYSFLRRSEDTIIEGAFGKAAEIAITATSKIQDR